VNQFAFFDSKEVTMNKLNTFVVHTLMIGGLCVSLMPSIALALTLEEVIAQTLKDNPDVQAARQEVLARQHEVRGARAGYFQH